MLGENRVSNMPPTPTPQNHASHLIEEIYDNLRALAASRLQHLPPGQTLQPTALVHEVYLKLAKQVRFANASHFFHAASQAMRHLLVDAARKRATLKRGSATPASLSDSFEPSAIVTLGGDPDELLALDLALKQLESQDSHCAQIVMLRCFAGLSNPQVAQAMNIEPDHAERSWRFARAFLRRLMSGEQL